MANHSDLVKAPIRVDLVGVDGRARERFESVFRDLGQGDYLIVNSTVAEVAIVDLDNPDGNSFWHRYCQTFPNRPMILLSHSKPPVERWERFLHKPIHVDALLEVLKETRRRIESLDGNVNSGANLEAADNVEPGTIKITEQSSLVPPGGVAWREEPSTAAGDPTPGSAPSGESKPSDSHAIVDLLEVPQAPAHPPGASKTGSDEAPEYTGTSEQTYRYPLALRASVDDDDPSSQQQTDKSPDAPFVAENPSHPADGLTLYERTSRVRIGLAAAPQATFLSPQDRLLGLVQAAVKKSTLSEPAIEVTLEVGDLVVDGPKQRVYCDLTDAQIKQLAKRIFPSTDGLLRACSTDSRAPTLTGGNSQSIWDTLEAFLWKLALWTYRGCLPLGTRLEQRVYLKYWPNLTRLHLVPDAMRIAALWSEQPMTLGYTAKALGIPQQHVFNFYCASHTIGLAGQARREADYLFQETSTHPKGKSGFVADMMKRLRSIGNT